MNITKRMIAAPALLSVLFLGGCVTKTFTIAPPAPAGLQYAQKAEAGRVLTLQDARDAADRPFSIGTLNTVLHGIDNELQYLGKHVSIDLKQRGANLNYETAGNGAVALKVNKFRIRNQRTSGFSPYYTFTTFSGDLTFNGKTQRITAYFKNGKVPVWGFDEVKEPCYDIPLSLVVKEVASKINRHVYGLSASKATVDALYRDITDNYEKLSYFKVMELGYSNNPAAIPYLVKLTTHEDSMMRATAVSALGILQAADQLDLLKKFYAEHENTEKYMALKSIGDLGTREAMTFLQSVKTSAEAAQDMAIREIVELYL